MKKHPARAHARHRSFMHRVIAWRLPHVAWYGIAVVGALFALVVIAARLLLPMVAEKKADLEALIARESGYTVRIEQLEDHWDGLYPGLRLRGISVQAPGSDVAAVQLDELRVSLQLLPLLAGRANIHSAVLVRPTLTLERFADGRFRITGFGAIEQADPAQTETFVAWLFRQHRLIIEDGELQWLDRREPGRPLKLTHVNLGLENSGERHRLGVAAEFPEGICTGCSMVADVRGNPLLSKPFDGDVYVRARDVNIARLPWVIREQLPELLRGTFSVELWSEWEESLPVAVEGGVSVTELRLPLHGLRAPLSLKQASTALHWEGRPEEFRAEFDDLTIALHDAPWSVGELVFERDQDKTSLRIGRIELADITAFIASLRLERAQETLPYEESAAIWNTLKPVGVIRDVRAELTGALDAPQDYSVVADVEGLGFESYRDWPGMRGVGGRLWVTPDEGTLKLAMRDGMLALPSVFRAPLPVTRAEADLQWRYQVDQWVISTDNISFVNQDIDASGRLLFRMPDDKARSPFLSLSMAVHAGDGTDAARYYPARHLLPTTLAWMEHAFAGGRITRGSIVYEGNTRDFPFTGAPGKFEIRARVQDGIYRYLRGWEPVTGVTANVAVTGDRFSVTGQGRIGALAARDIVVESGDSASVRVSANVAGATNEFVRVLREVEAVEGEGDWKQWLPPALAATGEGTLGLTISVPIAGADTVRVRGEYRFLGGSLALGDTGLAATSLGGSVSFSERGVREGRVRARLFGGETTLDITSPNSDETIAALRGRATAEGLAPLLGATFAPHVSGAVTWEARLRLLDGRPEITADADLSTLKTLLPAPFDRAAGFGAEKLRVYTESGDAREIVLGVEVSGMLRSRLRLERRPTWRFAAGRLVFYETPSRLIEPLALSGEEGLQVQALLDDFDLDRWRAMFGGDSATALPAWLRRVGASMRRLVFLGRDFGTISLDLARDADAWVGGVSGAAADGRLRLEADSAARVTLDLAHLRLPPALRDTGVGNSDPRHLPYLSLRVRQFEARNKEVGELDFVAEPTAQGWRIERLVLARPETRFEASGNWRTEYGQSFSSFNAHITSEDVGKTMEAFGLPDQIEGTSADLKAQLSWNGTPGDLEYASLNGNIELNANKGRLLKLQQGAARLFGILDLSAIGRYLTLDFTPIFGKGFAFDRIQGRMVLERGNVYTDELSIRGPSARLNFAGRVGLTNEDFNITLDVYPKLSDSLTLGGLVAGGPQVALWTLIVQKLFKKQIEEGTRVTYFVKGPWDKPEVTRKLVELPAGGTN